MSDTLSRSQILGSKGQPVGTPYEDYHDARRRLRRDLVADIGRLPRRFPRHPPQREPILLRPKTKS